MHDPKDADSKDAGEWVFDELVSTVDAVVDCVHDLTLGPDDKE